MKEIRDDTNRWENIPSLWTESITIVKMSMLHKANCSFNAITTKLTMVFSTELEKMNSQFVWKYTHTHL